MPSICYPATPAIAGVDAVFNTTANLGWNAGAASLHTASGNAYAEFSFGVSNVGSLAGFASAGAAVGAFNAITHGVLYAGDTLQVVESGGTVVDSGITPTSATIVRIWRTRGVVTYLVDGWSYVGMTPSTGDIQLAAVLYAAGDYVDNPQMVSTDLLTTRSSWGWSDDVTRRSMRAASPWGWATKVSLNDGDIHTVMDLSMSASDYPTGSLAGEVADLGVSAQAGFAGVEASGISFVTDMSGSAVGSSVIGGDTRADIPTYAIVAEDVYGYLAGEVADVSVLAVDTGEAYNAGSYTDGVYVLDQYLYDPVLYALLSEHMSVGDLIEVIIALDASLLDTLVALDEADATSVLYALINSGITMSDDAASTRATLLQYATNLVTGAVSRYEGFDFQGFCSVGMDTYGWKSDGLYKVGAETDNGALISAMVDFAANDFDTAQRKRMDAVFFGLSTDGDMLAKVTDDNGDSVTYRVMPRGSEARANMQRGDSSRYWRVQLQIIDATYAELDNVEWVVGATGRRTTR